MPVKIRFSKRVARLSASPTLALDTLAKELQSQGKRVINLTAGEPDLPTPVAIRLAAKKALDQGHTRYQPAAGIRPLRTAIARKLKLQNKILASWDEVVVGIGAKQLLAAALFLLCQEGDEVIVPIPTWGTFISQVHLTGATPVLLRLKEPFILTAKEVEKKISPKTRVLIVNSPANPTGAVIPGEEIGRLVRLATKHKFFILSDETYEAFVYERIKLVSPAAVSESARKQTITINTLSKTYAMTGWRIGYAHAPKVIADKLMAFNSQTTSGTNSLAQYAALEAITGKQVTVARMRRLFKGRRKLVLDRLKQIPGVSVIPPAGAFYCLVNIHKLLKDGETSSQWCERLLENQKVAVVPGEAFMAPGFMRMSFAAAGADLETGLNRIKKFARNL